jgi:8-oxo-dGTP diphosphatase
MKKFTYKYPHPAVATDVVVFALMENSLAILLVERKLEPFAGRWALPGGFLKEDETLDECAKRELHEETGVEIRLLQPIGNFSDPDRDPRERVISVAYYALTPIQDHRVKAATDAADAQWFTLENLPELAFDHADIVQVARERLRLEVGRLDPAVMRYLFALLPQRFTLSSLQSTYEAILGTEVDKRNFRKMIEATNAMRATGQLEYGGGRPAQIYEAAGCHQD